MCISKMVQEVWLIIGFKAILLWSMLAYTMQEVVQKARLKSIIAFQPIFSCSHNDQSFVNDFYAGFELCESILNKHFDVVIFK